MRFELPLSPALEPKLGPALRVVDELSTTLRFDEALLALERLELRYPDLAAVKFRLATCLMELGDPWGAEDHLVWLKANLHKSERMAGLLSQSLFHCYLDIGNIEAAEAEGRDYFSSNPDEESPYREGYRELVLLRQEWKDSEIAARVAESRD